MGTTLFDGNPQHDGRDHGAHPLPCVELDATTARAGKLQVLTHASPAQLSRGV